MLLRKILVLSVGGLLCLAASAAAAPPWSAPQPVAGSEAPPAIDPQLAFNAGRGLLGWTASPDPTRVGARRTGRIVALRDGAVSGSARSLAPYDLAAAPVAYGRTRAVVLQRRPLERFDVDRAAPPRSRLAVAFGRMDGSLGPRRVLEDDTRISDVDIAGNDRGDIVVAWVEDRGGAHGDRLWVAVRRPGGSFGGASVLVGSGAMEQVDVAVGARGDMQVAFTRRAIVGRGLPVTPSDGRARRVQARFRRAGRSFDRIRTLGENRGFVNFAGAVSDRGRAYLAWGTQDIGEEADEPWRVFAAVKPAGSSRYRSAQTLDPGNGIERPTGPVAIALGPAQSATVAWSGVVVESQPTFALRFPVRTATMTSSGSFAALQEIPGANGPVAGVVAAADGTTTVAWSDVGPQGPVGRASRGGMRAAVRLPGTTGFGATEVVTEPPLAANAEPAALGLDPADSRPVVAFVPSGRSGLSVSSRGD
jgi:hypothetical protein